jgi:hypothetical protein
MRDLLVVVPSRGRPASVSRLAQAMAQTCTAATTLAVGLDDDDERQYPRLQGVEYEVRSGLRQVTAWTNELAVPRAAGYRAVGCLGDDNVPRTAGWDARILEALQRTPFAFGNDLYPRDPGSMSCHVFMRSEVVQALGYAGAPSISHMYVDVAWFAWGTACGITYLDDVVIEHLHYSNGKAGHDQTYAASYALTAADLQNWHAYSRGGQLNADIAKLGGTPFTPQSLAEFNRGINVPDRWPG